VHVQSSEGEKLSMSSAVETEVSGVQKERNPSKNEYNGVDTKANV